MSNISKFNKCEVVAGLKLNAVNSVCFVSGIGKTCTKYDCFETKEDTLVGTG